MRSWATPNLFSCWTQEEAQTPAGYISNHTQAPNEVTQPNTALELGEVQARVITT